ncbi:antitoxin Xre/MbcA/ParS toxin-binding domain-containing protein [Aeromonas jandaei]|uniref:antitoxin Xre/MbcA/ParS toxin-binding domain-containing protein n=2 Tax=Aeromonas jandaei TaxID=650 RepID=UPI002B05F3FF|nr:antitoxin Xre/MbcA/ParS toxin-binding domain-containing protein [Aeromonas jandaei]
MQGHSAVNLPLKATVWSRIAHERSCLYNEECYMMPYATYHPSSDAAATANYLLEALGIPCDPLGAHQWIVAGVAPDIVYQLAELMKTDVGTVCQWAGISRSTLARKLRIAAPLSISQGARVYGVAHALDTVLVFHRNDTVKTLSWLKRIAWGLGGVAPSQLLNTPMGVQAVVNLVGRIRHGVCL